MNIIISNSSSIPIYEQIKQHIINQILTGKLKENEMLPSIRSLAKDIRISVMTIKKAYDELEQEGFIVTRHGKGSFVATKNFSLAREQKIKEIEEHLNCVVEISKCYEIDKKDVIDVLEYLYGEE